MVDIKPKDMDEIVLDGKETEEELKENDRLHALSAKYTHRIESQTIYHGMLQNKVVNKESITKLLELPLREDDVVICGYPRSGTTWLGEILSLIQSNVDIDYIQTTMCYSRILWIDDLRAHKHMTMPREAQLLKTHLPARLFVPSLVKHNCKCVLAMRNPKDLAVSWYYLNKSLDALGNYTGSFSEWLPMFIDGYVQHGDWFHYINEWWEAVSHHKNILPVFYEDLQDEPHETVSKISSFLGKSFSTEQIDTIVQNTKFNKMKANPMSNLSNLKSVKLPFIRKGKVRNWMEHFSEEESNNFDKLMEEKIENIQLLNKFQKYC